MRILVVDDEIVAQTKMETILNDFGDCDTAGDGQSALMKFQQAYLQGDPYDLISIDIDMPKIDGLKLLKMINHDEEMLFIKPSKKIMITAEGTSSNVYHAIQNRCDAFMVKPIKKGTLVEKLKSIGI